MQFSLLLMPLLSASAFALADAPLEERGNDTPWIGCYHPQDKDCTGDKHTITNLPTPNTLETFSRPMKSNVGVHFGSGNSRAGTVNAYLDAKGKKIAHTFAYSKDIFQCFSDENDGVWAQEWKSAESMG